MLRRLFGVAEPTEVAIRNEKRRLKSPADAIAAGIGMVPGERRLGLVMNQSVRDNILLPSLDRLSRVVWLDRRAGDRIVAELMELLDIRPRRPQLEARALSGGNQQKVILAKWLARRVGVLLLEEPTQGIDVAAKAQIHALIRDFVARGGGALINSSDLGELARLCDCVLAVRQGRIAAALDRAQGLDEPQAARGDRRLTWRERGYRLNLAGQMPLISLDRAVRGDGAADRPLPLAAQSHQHPGAVLDHGGDRASA